jgi:hypothetical protein
VPTRASPHVPEPAGRGPANIPGSGDSSRNSWIRSLRRSESQCRPHVVDGHLPDRVSPSVQHERGQDVPVEVSAKVAGLRVGDPGETTVEGRVDGGLAYGVKRSNIRGEDDDGICTCHIGGRDATFRQVDLDGAVKAEHRDGRPGLDLKLGADVHLKSLAERGVRGCPKATSVERRPGSGVDLAQVSTWLRCRPAAGTAARS